MKFKKTKQRVLKLMAKKPHLRDNDNALIVSIWWLDLGIRARDMQFIEFGYLFSEHKVTPAESIRRARQQIEEEYPELRGKTYKKRHNKKVKESREELGYNQIRKPFVT